MIVGAHIWVLYSSEDWGKTLTWKCPRCRIEQISKTKPLTRGACQPPLRADM